MILSLLNHVVSSSRSGSGKGLTRNCDEKSSRVTVRRTGSYPNLATDDDSTYELVKILPSFGLAFEQFGLRGAER